MKKHFPLCALGKIFLFSFVVILFASSALYSQQITYKDSWGPQGMTLTRQNSAGVEVNFSIVNFEFVDVNAEGSLMKAPKIPGIFLPGDEGMPDLAGTGRLIAIPQGAYVTFKILSARTEVIKDILISPAPRIPKDTEVGPLQYRKNNSVYSRNEYYPESPVKVSAPTKIRGVDVVMLGITPYQYNPVTKELIVYKDIKVEVSFIGGNGRFGEDRLRSPWFDPIIKDAVFNSSSLPVIDFGKRTTQFDKEKAYGYEYVIITPNGTEFAQWADTIKNFRIAQGIKTGIFKISQIPGGNTPTAIENFINTAYNTWPIPPAAVLILADYGTNDAVNITAPIYNNYCVSDNIWGDIDGNHLPEVVMARITANNSAQLQVMITKFLNYEKNPPTNPNFYNKPITALGWQTERWFQICSEVVGGFWKKIQGKNPVRVNAIYSGSPGSIWSSNVNTPTVVNYFGPAGLYYIPLTPDSLGGWSGGTATMINNAINNGAFMLQHRDHGGETGWGEPAYNNSSINGCTNTDLTWIMSINCLTGKYNWSSECFTEKFHRYTYNNQNSGALGLIAASEVSYSFVNDTYVWGMMDNLWPNFMPGYGTTPPSRDVRPAFGNAAGKYFLFQSSWPYNTSNKEVTYHLFHHHGDAFLDVYSEVPQNLTVSHASVVLSGVTTFNVTANAGSFIAITLDTNILGTATGTGSPVAVTLPGTQVPGQTLKIVITKQNYYRYQAGISVIPPTGPYVVKDSVAINDASPLGNGNGMMDYGETNKLALRVKNVGSATATSVNVKVTESDAYITMTDSTEVYGNINAGATMLKTDAFAYTVANNIPDNHVVNFTVSATSGTNTWVSYFSLTGHAGCLNNGYSSVNDSAANNNGRWDPGETVMIKLCARNIGSAMAYNVAGTISENDPYVTINTANQTYGNIGAGDSTLKQFSVTSGSNTPAGHEAKIVIAYTGNYGLTCTDTAKFVIGQNVAIIGNGTTSCGYPYYTFYMDSRTQMLYTAAEILGTGVAPGYITKIGFDVTSAASQVMNGFMVKMQNYSGSSLSSFVTTGMTTVHSTPYTVPGTGWQYVNLTTPFYWNGTSNLLIEICFNNSSYTSNSTVNGTPNSLSQLKHAHSDLSSGDGCVQITSPSSSYTARPNISLTINAATSVGNNMNGVPTVYNLSQNYPNPFNPVTRIEYAIPKQGLVTLKVYDILGREVSVLVNDVKEPGYYSVDFEGSRFASGVYFYRMQSGTFTETKRFMLIK